MTGGLIERLPMWFLAGAMFLATLVIGYAVFVSDRCLYVLGLQTGPCQTQSADALPADAVMAFDRAGCPAGWTPMREAQSRVIIGAIGEDGFLSAYDTDEAGRPLTERRYREKGGSEAVALLSDQVPELDHVWLDTLDDTSHKSKPIVENPAAWTLAIGHAGSKNHVSAPHPNMPPYIALHFCKKD